MRKIYETDADRQRQERVASQLETSWGCKYRKSVNLACVDGGLFNRRGDLKALIEIKTRRNSSNKYPTYMLSARKWREALKLSEEYAVPFLLIVEFTNGTYAVKIKNDYPVNKGGRYDRGDAMDVEDCIYIPMSDFRRV